MIRTHQKISTKAFLLIGVLGFIFILTLILILFYKRSSNELLEARSSSISERLRIETFSEFERFRRAFFNRVSDLIQNPPLEVVILAPDSIERNLGNFFSETENINFEFQCVGQGRPNFQNSVCNLSADINNFPKLFRLRLRLHDSSDQSQAGQVSGLLQIMPQQLADYSLILRNSSQPVVFGNGEIDGNVAISFSAPPENDDPDLPSNALYFLNDGELRFKGNLKIGNAHTENFFLYGKNPSGDPLDDPGQVIMEKGYSTSVDIDAIPIEEILEKLNKSCPNNLTECSHPESDLANQLIKAQAPPEGWTISEARLKFGKENDECRFQFEQTEQKYESDWQFNCGVNCANCSCDTGFSALCLGPMLYCERIETVTKQVWPTSGSAKIPDKSVIAVDSSVVKIQSLDPNATKAETCGSSFTVLGTQGGSFRFDQSFVDSELEENPSENLKVAFALLGGNGFSTPIAADLRLDTKLLNGSSIKQIYDGTSAPPSGEESFKIHATLIAAANGEDNRPISVTLPPNENNGNLGKLQIWGAEIANRPSQLRRISNADGTVLSGFGDIERRFLRNVAPGLNSETAVSLQSSLSHLEYKNLNFKSLLEEAGIDWQKPPN